MMNSFFDKMDEKLMPFASKVSANRYLNAIKEGFFGVMPVIIVGSLFLLFTSIPINGYSELMTGLLGENWSQIFMVPYRMSYGIMSIYVVVGIARSLAHFYKVDTRESIVVSFIAIFMLTPVLVTEDGLKGLPLDNFSASGLFLAIITTCLAVEIFRFVVQKGWTIKLPDSVPQNVAKPFEALIPVAIIFIIFNFVRIGFEMTSFKSAQNFIFTMLQQPLQSIGSTLPATILVLLIESILWIFGLHGSSIVSSVMNPIWRSLSAENAAAIGLGKAATHIVNYQFIANFVKLGGTAATLGLALVIVFTAKSSRYKALGKLSLIPSLFNINEPLIFGLPLMYNPIMMIPFIIVMPLNGLITYLAMSSGLVARTFAYASWNMFSPIAALIDTMDFKAVLLIIFLIVVDILIYLPFFKAFEKEKIAEEGK
mgnify:CR=1 FL=1